MNQKFFPLVCVFGFNAIGVARMFNGDRSSVHMKVKRMADQYQGLFSASAGG